MVAPQALAQIGVQIRRASLLDLAHRHVFHQDVRRHHDEACQRCARAGGIQQGDGGAIAVAHQPQRLLRGIHLEGLQQGRQYLVCLTVHEVRRPGLTVGPGSGAAIAGARINEPPTPCSLTQLLRKIFPHCQRPQTLVQKHQQRGARSGAFASDPLVFDADQSASPVQVNPVHSVAHRVPASNSRSLKRWIFPVAVLGRSSRNSIWRGYL